MRNLKLLRIVSIIKDAGFGGTKPIIVKANDKRTYILKTREDGTNPKDLGIFNEVWAYQIHDYLELKISPQNICYLFIDDLFIEAAKSAVEEGLIEEESYEYISQSKGINIGIEFIEDAMEITDGTINKQFIRETMRLDNYMVNYDRVEGSNPNILQDKKNKKKFYAIDYGNALADAILYDKVSNGTYDITHLGLYSSCNALMSSNRYMFRTHTDLMNYKHISQDLVAIKTFLNTITDNMPPEWEPIRYKDELIEIISIRVKDKRIFNTSSYRKCECMY